MNKLRIALAQINLTLGDIQGNLAKHMTAALRARDEIAADVIVFPELSLTGYPPEDLLFRRSFLTATQDALLQFMAKVQDIHCIIGHPAADGEFLYNAASVIYNGQVIAQCHKQSLPNYSVFDELRYFKPGKEPCIFIIKNIKVGVVICEDLWRESPVRMTKQAGAEVIICPNASPYETNKLERRVKVVRKRAHENDIPIVYVNLVGGQDEIVFDGGSFALNPAGEIKHFAGFFNESLTACEIEQKSQGVECCHTLHDTTFVDASLEDNIYQALVLGLRDYIAKNKFPGVLLGLSGGIDSALTLCIAVDALGADKVKAILMPSRYTAAMSVEDSETLAKTLNVKTETISIEPLYQSCLETLKPPFANRQPDLTEENIQARLRAVILMALSNKFGPLVLTTGNRSELAVGYCTLYGDMAGGYDVLKDISKTDIFKLAKYRNRNGIVIPQRIIDRPPSAELAPNQKDEDSLPPYPILDDVLHCFLNLELTKEEIVARGYDAEMVTRIIDLVYKNEYKRRQSAIGPRINLKSFGKDWRYPVTNRFKG